MKKSNKKKAARRLERASSLPQMDLLTVDGELRRLDLTSANEVEGEEDMTSDLELSAVAGASPGPQSTATVKGLFTCYVCNLSVYFGPFPLSPVTLTLSQLISALMYLWGAQCAHGGHQM